LIAVNLDTVYSYQTGDYWLVPARTATGDVEWPKDASEPRLLRPHGVDHHYAPLAYINNGEEGNWVQKDCRCPIKKALNPPCGDNAVVRKS